MTSKVYTVYDRKIEAFMGPFLMKTKGEALRAWSDTVNDPNTQFNKHPEDFVLYEVAEYDDTIGKFQNHQEPINMGVATEVKRDNISTVERLTKQQ